jgi:PAS domain S-box-containing protein
MVHSDLNNSAERKDDSPALVESMGIVLAAAFDELSDAIYLFDPHRCLSRFNDAAALLDGARSVTLPGRRCCDMFWSVEANEQCVVDRAMESGCSVEFEMMVGANGDQPILLIAQPLKKSEASGTVLVVARDISKLRQVEAQALEHKAFMASVADRSPDEIYALDTVGRVTWMNERAEKDQLLMLAGRHFSEFIAIESRDLANENFQRTLAGDETQFEVRAIRIDGTVRHVELQSSPLWKDGSVDGVLVFLRDVTDRKQAQELMAQADKLRAVGELAAGVAHNLNNSLTVIKGRAQLLLMRNTDEPTIKDLKVIANAVEDGAKTLRRILEFARREAVTEFAPVELGELLTSTLEISRPKWERSKGREQGNEIAIRFIDHNPVYVVGEVAELREVVLNLIFNAVDAMPSGGTIEVGTRAELDTGCFWVADTGCGMPPETVARIFEPFYTTKGKKGTGLGLSASHGIISRHNGEIMLVSEPGEGTRFEVRLPLCAEESRFIKQIVDEPRQASETAAPRIVIVEDEDLVRSLLSEAFVAAGHDVVTFSKGTDAINHLALSECELVVSDLGLPDISGLQISRWVKANRPHLYFILATGWSERLTPADYVEGRIDAVFKKPYSATEIANRASELLLGNVPITRDEEVSASR